VGPIRNITQPPIQHITISKGSCDTEDWSNGSWKFSFTGINYILKYIEIAVILIIFHKCNCFYCIFYQINAAFGEHTSLKGNSLYYYGVIKIDWFNF